VRRALLQVLPEMLNRVVIGRVARQLVYGQALALGGEEGRERSGGYASPIRTGTVLLLTMRYGPIAGSLPCAGYASSAGPTVIMVRATAV
jgi:hypothetical protein